MLCLQLGAHRATLFLHWEVKGLKYDQERGYAYVKSLEGYKICHDIYGGVEAIVTTYYTCGLSRNM